MFRAKWFFCLWCLFVVQRTIAQHKMHFHHDYAHTLVMKLFLSAPAADGGSMVAQDFVTALETIKTVDQLTLGVPKIIYLVGWQYNGHDDQYPAFFEVNNALKRPQDANALQSLKWLMAEAKNYHTVVSLHINMTDAYDNSVLWKTYQENNLLSKNADGGLLVIGQYNNKKAYQINYAREWEAGFAQRRVDQLLELLPELQQAGTVHLDAWIARESKGDKESMVKEAQYQQKLADYWLSKGIDPTTEWVMDYMENRVPYYWHFNGRTQQDYLAQPASLVTGSRMNPDLKQSDFGLEFLFGTSIYGENLFPDKRKAGADSNWTTAFQKDFYLNFLQYNFLNACKRLEVLGEGVSRMAVFADDVRSSLADSTVRQGEQLLRRKQTVCFPVTWRNDNSFAAYSSSDVLWKMKSPKSWRGVQKATTWNITKNGLVKAQYIVLKNGEWSIPLKAGQPILFIPEANVIKTAQDTSFLTYNSVKKNHPHPAYHQTLTMKLFMSNALFDGKYKRRDNGKTELFLNAEQALEVIKKMDRLSIGMPKIVYLVGWQYNGHDSGYPAWFKANASIKRSQDADAMESLRWLMREAKQYYTTVSLHINMFDAYEDSELWDTYVKNNVIARKKDGSLLGGEWGYPISYAQEWATGLAQQRIDRLCQLLPIQEAGTIHIDAFHTWPPLPVQDARGNWTVDLDKKPTSPFLPFTVADETAAQKKIYAYWANKGIDVTSEGVDFLREDGFEEYQSMAWWFNGKSNYLKWPADVYIGGADNSIWGKLFGTSMHGEDLVRKDAETLNGFKEQFCTRTLIWYFLNRLNRAYLIEGAGKQEVHFQNGVVTSWQKNRFQLSQNGILLADDDNVLIPAQWINTQTLIAYSKNGYVNKNWKLPVGYNRFKKATVYRIDANGEQKIKEIKINKGQLQISLDKDEMLLFKLY